MFRRRKPSEYIRRHLAGGAYDLDDLVSLGRPELKKAADEVIRISQQFRTVEFPIGIANPASRAALQALAERLEAEGH